MPMILTAEMVKAIVSLIHYRGAAGVSKENKYIFAAPTRGSMKSLRGYDCLSAVVQRCGVKNPSAIKSTKLRKYVATVSQIVDLDDREMNWLARHMGHDLSVHKEYYRLHENTIELSKVSRLLLAVDEGSAGKWAGKKLDEITLQGKFIIFFLKSFQLVNRLYERPMYTLPLWLFQINCFSKIA